MKTLLAGLFIAVACVAAEYEFREQHDPNGLGKFYMGREIAHYMTHEGADWLERPEREQEERPDLLVKALKLKPGMHVADIGAGTGYFTRRTAKEVLPGGKVYAVEIQQEMLDQLTAKLKPEGITNVVAVLGTEKDPRLPPATLDLIFMVDVYHEVAFPKEMLEKMKASLKKGGKLVFVEYRKEDPKVPIKEVHKMAESQIRKEAEASGFKFLENYKGLPRQHLLVFQNP